MLRDRLLDFARKNRLVPGEDHSLDRMLPKPRRPQPVTNQLWISADHQLTKKEELTFANAELIQQETSLVSPVWRLHFLPSARHASTAAPAHSASQLPSFLATNLRASRWLPHSRFRHSAHRMLECAKCHDATTSTATSNVLMPHLEKCAECHNRNVGHRHDCVECHAYHGRGGSLHPTLK